MHAGGLVHALYLDGELKGALETANIKRGRRGLG